MTWSPLRIGRLRGARAVVTGAAGFLGSHLCDRLLGVGATVVAIDNLATGRASNLEHLIGRDGFRFLHHDVTDYLYVRSDVDYVLHFASPASPIDYLRAPIQTLKVGAQGTHNALGLARAKDATFMLASTGEVYGDPQVNPQPEAYWGHVNPVGPRGVNDEAKRFAEAMTVAYHRTHGVEIRIARIFNTYGHRMRPDDGRAVPTFIRQALLDQPLTVHGDGSQTRSLCYIEDAVEGLMRLLVSDVTGPVNIGNQHELTVRELAETVVDVCGSASTIQHTDRPQDDPAVRRPDTSTAENLLGWRAEVPLRDGLQRTVAHFRALLDGGDVARARIATAV